MNRQKKEVRAICHEPIALDPRYRQTWADVWIRFKCGRQLVCKGPTLAGTLELESDLALTRACMESNPELMATWEVDLARDLAIQERLRTHRVVVDDASAGCPNLYIAAEDFNRSGAETMLLALLNELGVNGPVRFDWPRPECYVTPMTIPAQSQENPIE